MSRTSAALQRACPALLDVVNNFFGRDEAPVLAYQFSGIAISAALGRELPSYGDVVQLPDDGRYGYAYAYGPASDIAVAMSCLPEAAINGVLYEQAFGVLDGRMEGLTPEARALFADFRSCLIGKAFELLTCMEPLLRELLVPIASALPALPGGGPTIVATGVRPACALCCGPSVMMRGCCCHDTDLDEEFTRRFLRATEQCISPACVMPPSGVALDIMLRTEFPYTGGDALDNAITAIRVLTDAVLVHVHRIRMETCVSTQDPMAAWAAFRSWFKVVLVHMSDVVRVAFLLRASLARLRRSAAVRAIQGAWRRAVSCPEYAVCQRRLRREAGELESM